MTLHLSTSSERMDADTREDEIARRNVLFGLWAGRRAGLEGELLEAYALSVHFVDLRSPGHDDVVAKIAGDLIACGKPLSDRQLRHRFREMAMRATLYSSRRWSEIGEPSWYAGLRNSALSALTWNGLAVAKGSYDKRCHSLVHVD